MDNLQEHGYTVAMYYDKTLVYAGRMSAEGLPVLSENAVRLDRFEADQVAENLRAAGWFTLICGYWQ
jgi:hypothetical protein